MTEVAERLADILGPRGWTPAAEAGPWQRDWLDRYGAPPLGVARPASTAEVSAVLAAAQAAGVPVVPQGAIRAYAAARCWAAPAASSCRSRA